MNKKSSFESNLDKNYREKVEMWLDEHRWAAVTLGVVAIGGVLSVGVFAPNILKVLGGSRKNKFNNRHKRALSDARLRLVKQGYITKFSYSQNNEYYKLTEKGRKKLMEYDLQSHSLKGKKPKNKWDKQWRVLLFDYPTKEKHTREVIRNMAKSFGFYQFQKNVWVYPYKEAEKLVEHFHLLHGKGRDKLVIITASRFVGDSILCEHFKL